MAIRVRVGMGPIAEPTLGFPAPPPRVKLKVAPAVQPTGPPALPGGGVGAPPPRPRFVPIAARTRTARSISQV